MHTALMVLASYEANDIVATYVEKFGLRIRDSKPSETGARRQSDPMDVDTVNSLSFNMGKRVIKSARWVF